MKIRVSNVGEDNSTDSSLHGQRVQHSLKKQRSHSKVMPHDSAEEIGLLASEPISSMSKVCSVYFELCGDLGTNHVEPDSPFKVRKHTTTWKGNIIMLYVSFWTQSSNIGS